MTSVEWSSGTATPIVVGTGPISCDEDEQLVTEVDDDSSSGGDTWAGEIENEARGRGQSIKGDQSI